jgi:hypothetical protein
MVACIDFFEMSEICRPKFIVRHSTLYLPEFIKKKDVIKEVLMVFTAREDKR